MAPDDDLFSRLFELFNQPGPINWKLAVEVARHLTGERVPVEPWAAEEYRELARLAEYRFERSAPLPAAASGDVLPIDAREWAERHLEAYSYLAEPFTEMAGMANAGPMGQLVPAFVGMQVGSLVGSVATWALAGFDAGLPAGRALPLAVIAPAVEEFAASSGLERSTVRLWAVSEEVAFRSLSAVPFVVEHLGDLVAAQAAATEVDPAALASLVTLTDPTELQAAVEGELAEMLGGEEAEAARREVEGFCGLVVGYSRLLAERACDELIPDMAEIAAARDRERPDLEAVPLALGPRSPSAATIDAGRSFCLEIERRYGPDELTRLWSLPDRFPSGAELSDPVAWAARVLLDGLL